MVTADRAGQLILAQFQLFQAGEPTEFPWNQPGQVVGLQIQAAKLGELSEFARDPAHQLVVVQKQFPQLRKVTEFDRYRAGQPMKHPPLRVAVPSAAKTDTDDSAERIRIHAVPLP